MATTAAIESRLHSSAGIDAADVDVRMVDGRVELNGLARTEAQKVRMEWLVRDTLGVVAVSNRLDVNDWTPITDVARAGAAMRATARQSAKLRSDPWITAAVQSTLILSHGIDRCDIGVTTRQGIVSLQGVVGSVGARDLAIALASDTWGVQSVDAAALRVD